MLCAVLCCCAELSLVGRLWSSQMGEAVVTPDLDPDLVIWFGPVQYGGPVLCEAG